VVFSQTLGSEMSDSKNTNRLINESSPYLLQHAHNPVDWYPWGNEAFEKARNENKLVLVSIGYSSCHWCHVMEKESFEDPAVAAIMNEKYVCIKVDREEHPEVDMLYMDAITILSGRGGWPLNCFTLPDGKPVYGGTYYPKEDWKQMLTNLSSLYKREPEKIQELSEEIEKGILSISFFSGSKKGKIEKDFKFIDEIVNKIATSFDKAFGGYNYIPKFPMPNNYEFLLYYSYALKNLKRIEEAEAIEKQVYLTLDKMAMGGIYDQVGGGFARYSTDSFWKVPHFEKMLYDNAQLMSLYSNAYKNNPKEIYKEVVYGIYKFVSSRLTSPEGAFYCSMDADSEGIEGEYYVWKKEELTKILGDNFSLFASYYNINNKDVWEEGKHILQRKESDVEFCEKKNITLNDFVIRKKNWLKILNEKREHRVPPSLDDKTLASWNGLMLKGLTDAYEAFHEPVFLNSAINNAHFIKDHLITKSRELLHSYKDGKGYIEGFLDDYAFIAHAFISLYEASFDERWLITARSLAEYAIEHFYNPTENIFYYTHKKQSAIIVRKADISDNVIPSSNSEMAIVLHKLGHLTGDNEYLIMAEGMLAAVKENMLKYPQGYTNWGILMIHHQIRFFEVAVTGKLASTFRDKINKEYLPNKSLLGSERVSDMELLKERFSADRTLVYVCENKTCQLPVSSVAEAINAIKEIK
jgi:uncharacterized protein YyaL (SSP411 family)